MYRKQFLYIKKTEKFYVISRIILYVFIYSF